MTDKDVIRHLISVENEADKVVEEAELAAEKKIALCRNDVELRFLEDSTQSILKRVMPSFPSTVNFSARRRLIR
ncbi:MAG: hypothetical protein IIW10_06715 [Spirochaetaceae bacterium]|nr:hypothetical protein [Spirochaetaceae bacterium]